MGKTIFQVMYDGIKSMKYPWFITNFLGKVEDIVKSLLFQLGRAFVIDLENAILSAQAIPGLTNPQKRDYAVTIMRAKYTGAEIADSALNLAIEMVVNILKKSQTI